MQLCKLHSFVLSYSKKNKLYECIIIYVLRNVDIFNQNYFKSCVEQYMHLHKNKGLNYYIGNNINMLL